MLNVKKVATVVGFITLFPEKHRQSHWFETNGDEMTAQELKNSSCGTTACAAGWASILFAPKNAVFNSAYSDYTFSVNGVSHKVGEFATQILGLTDEQAEVIFYSLNDEEIVPAFKHLISHPKASSSEILTAVGRYN